REGERCVMPGQREPSARLKAANALMLLKAKGDLISTGYAALLKEKYQAEVFRGAGLDEINGWVNRQTEGKIERILDQIDPEMVTVLLNAVYFKAAWQSPFIAQATKDADFHLTSSATVKVPMMRRTGHFTVLARPNYRAIRLPYSMEGLAMVIVLPNDIEGAPRLAGDLGASELGALFGSLTEGKQVEVALPRFKASFNADLGRPFMQAGMRRAFDLRLADFSGMTARPPAEAPLAISAILHRAVIDVAEYGTEAAAAAPVAVRTSYQLTNDAPFPGHRPLLF